MREKIKIGIVGGAGFAAGELLRILLQHPYVKIQFVHTESQAGKRVAYLHPDLEGECDLVFTDLCDPNVDVIFLCKGHGRSRAILQQNTMLKDVKIVDLSQDFRLKEVCESPDGRNFVYGLPELNRELIRKANAIANPGCFATSISLALLPLAGECTSDVHIHAITGSTGAGQDLSITSVFSWRHNNISTYKVFEHQHLHEIQETLQQANPSFAANLFMVPVRGNYTRGIFTTLYTKTHLSGEDIRERYKRYYEGHPFICVSGSELYLKKVINTNNVFISIRKHKDMVFIESILDNLVKGASGQAVQNMNIMFGIEETTALKMKSSAY